MKWLVWMEDIPETVVVVRSRWALFWKMNGLMGLRATFLGKRMRNWNGWDGSRDPLSEVRTIDACFDKRKK